MNAPHPVREFKHHGLVEDFSRPGVRFERTLIDVYDEPRDAVVFLQTIEHVTNPGDILGHFAGLVAGSARPAIHVSTPNVLTLAPEGAERSGNPWHVHEYRPEEFKALLGGHFASVDRDGWHGSVSGVRRRGRGARRARATRTRPSRSRRGRRGRCRSGR